jgi:hypothetical protein
MNYVFLAISAYIFMRAFEVIFADQKRKRWCKITLIVIGAVVLYTAFAAMLGFYVEDLQLLGLFWE